MSDGDLLTSGLDQPMSAGSTFWDQAKGGALSSFGLGTAVRDLGTPEAAPPVSDNPVANVLGAINRAIAPENIIRRIAGTEYDGSNPLTEDQYKASPSFRKDIPFQQGMTQERADALAQMDDVKQVRAFYADKRPVTAFVGNLAGSAIDPINYIPIAGEAVAAANTARFGKILGRTVTSALDASGNAAFAALGTAPTRAELGDDTSWQSTVSQIAMAAIIGGGFGALHGRFGRDAAPDLHAEANDKLSTLQNVQESRVALNDALDGMINHGQVEMSPASTGFVSRMADEELPKVAISRMAREADPASFDRLDTLNKTFDINDAEISRLQGLSLDNEKYGPTRAAMMEANALGDKLQGAEEAIEKAPTAKEQAAATARRDTIRQQLRDKLGTIDDTKVQEIEDIEGRLAQRRAVNEPVAAERDTLKAKADQLTKAARDQYWQERFSRPDPAPVDQNATEGDPNGPTTAPQTASPPSPSTAPRASIDTSSPVAAPDPAVTEAKTRVGKPEGSKALAEQYRVDPKTGDFPELDEIKQLDSEGRLTEEDKAAMDDADETLKTANAYGEALKAFANCII